MCCEQCECPWCQSARRRKKAEIERACRNHHKAMREMSPLQSASVCTFCIGMLYVMYGALFYNSLPSIQGLTNLLAFFLFLWGIGIIGNKSFGIFKNK